MNALVDTSVWIDFFRGVDCPELEESLSRGWVWTSPVVVAELLSGVRSPKEERDLLAFLEALPLSETPLAHWIAVGRLRQFSLKQGISLSTPDAHIAQTALDLKATLYTRDRVFAKIAPLFKLDVKGV